MKNVPFLFATLAVLALGASCTSERIGQGDDDGDAAPSSSPSSTSGGGEDGGGGAPDDGSGDDASCDEGEVEACSVEVGVQNRIKTCLPGHRTCADGKWGYCRMDPIADDEG